MLAIKVYVIILETVEQDRIAVDDKQFVTCIIANEINLAGWKV